MPALKRSNAVADFVPEVSTPAKKAQKKIEGAPNKQPNPAGQGASKSNDRSGLPKKLSNGVPIGQVFSQFDLLVEWEKSMMTLNKESPKVAEWVATWLVYSRAKKGKWWLASATERAKALAKELRMEQAGELSYGC